MFSFGGDMERATKEMISKVTKVKESDVFSIPNLDRNKKGGELSEFATKFNIRRI